MLNEAAINGRVDKLEGMKENVICGHLIPAGTGQREFDKIIVGSREEYDRILANRMNVLDYSEVEQLALWNDKKRPVSVEGYRPFSVGSGGGRQGEGEAYRRWPVAFAPG